MNIFGFFGSKWMESLWPVGRTVPLLTFAI